VIFSEIPSNVTNDPGPAQVKVVTRVSIPIFVKPAGTTPTLEVLGLTATKDRVAFQIRNKGGAHALLNKVDVKFLSAQGKVLNTTDVPGWYVLPGNARPFQLALGKDASCTGASSLVVTAASSTGASTSKTLPAPACAN
jgi:fimbrial chaperone protein